MLAELLNRLAYLFRRKRFDSELDAELTFHLETRAAELEAEGLPHAAALLQARREFGPAARMQEETRSAWQLRWLEDLLADLRYAARAFRRNPGFTLTAVVCLALGIGANTTIFSITSEVLFSRPSVRQPETLVSLEIGGNSHATQRNYRFLRESAVFEGLAGENEEIETNWRNGSNTQRLYAVRVTGNFFDMTGIPVLLGRPPRNGEDDAAVLSFGLWQRGFGGDPNVIGRAMVLDGRIYRIAAVLPRDHRTLLGFGFAPELYLPVVEEKTIVALFARLPHGMNRPAAVARLTAAVRELDRVYPEEGRRWADSIRMTPVSGLNRLLSTDQLMPIAAFFAMLMVVVGLVLLIACANVASLLLARAASRSQELAIRLSIGAGRGRLIRQLLAESLLLAGCGTAAGLALNILLTAALSRIRLPMPLPLQYLIHPDWPLLVYAALLSIGTSLAAGLLPALRATRAGIGASLKRDVAGGRRWNLRNGLVVCQLAVSLVLLCAAFLFVRNLVRASTTRPGFDVEYTVWSYMRLVPESYTKPEKTDALIAAALDRLRALPGVESAAIARIVPLNDNLTNSTSVRTDISPQPVHVSFKTNFVGPGYFHTMDIALVEGRDFTAADRRGAPRVAIVNENAARRLFGAVSPIGHTVDWDGPVRIVGVARNSKYFTLGEANAMAWYAPYDQMNQRVPNLHFLLRATGSPEPLVRPVNAALGGLDSTAAIDTKPMSKALVFALLPSRFGAAILGSVGLLGLALSAIGLYGALLYAVSGRIREIGLRMALGATPAGVIAMVVRQSAGLAATGIGIGLALAVLAVRPLSLFLTPEVSPTDPSTFVVVAAVLFAAALTATVPPVLLALRIDPIAALRNE
jgi:predicted permease